MNITELHQTFNYRQNYTNIFEKIWLLRQQFSPYQSFCAIRKC
jgi:hypothetical protein